MKKLYLMLDEWDNDRNFVGGELELVAKKYDVTVVCNSAREMLNPDVKYAVYTRPGKLHAMAGLLRMIVDGDAWSEIGRVFKEESGKLAKLSEAVRFYINADLFRSFMKKRGYLEDGAIYYSYWYFWKCYAITHEIDKYPRSRVITRTHEYDLYDYTSPSGYQPFKVSMEGKLDHIVFIAEHGRDYYLAKYNKEPGDKYLLYRLGTKNPFDGALPCDAFDDIQGDMRDGSESVFHIVSCSSIIERKRVYRIAEALSLINDLDVKWVHFGTGDKEADLISLCKKELDNKHNISYELKGYVNNEDLHEYYRNNRIDAFVSASSSEGNPVSVMEAMSYGIPIIAPSICNFPNMIRGSGALVPEDCRPFHIAEAIQRLAAMPAEDIAGMRMAARKCWEDDFDADKNNRRFVEEVLDSL